jgi:hypothetical protein
MEPLRWLQSLRWHTVVKIFVFLALLYAANHFTHYIVEVIDFDIRPSNEDSVHRVIMTSAVLYSMLLALPFVPGAEIGIALLMTLGPPIALLVYLCTVIGLTISFLIGRLVPISIIAKVVQRLGLAKTSALLAAIEPLNQQQRLSFLTSRAPNKMVPWLLRSRYVGLGVLFNLPGNFLIGGGGGIGLIAGLSGLFSFLGYFLTVAIAVSPVPLAVGFFGAGILK